MGIEAAIIGSSVIGAGAGIAASRSQSSAAKKAASVSNKAAASDRALTWDMYQQQRRDFDRFYGRGRDDLVSNFRTAGQQLDPYDRWGPQATNRLAALAGVNGGQAQLAALQSDPGYQFRMQQGIQALDRSAASRGMLLSGAQNKALTEFGQGLASSELNNAYNRTAGVADAARSTSTNLANLYQQRGTALSNLATGQASQVGNLATNTTNALTNISQNNVANQTNALNNIGQARASAFTNVGNAANSGVQNYLFYQGMQNGWFNGGR